MQRRLLALAVCILATIILSPPVSAQPREETAFGSNPGNLRMFSYVPHGLAPGAPLVVVLHGCKQNAAAFASEAGWIALADRIGAALALPEQKGMPPAFHDVYVFPGIVKSYGANNQNACFNWFERANAARDQGEALSIRQMIDVMVERHALDSSRVFIAGLSAGGAMAAALLADYPERFAGGAIVAGVPAGCAETLGEALRCMNPGVDRTPAEWRRRIRDADSGTARVPRVTIWHGGADTRVAPRNRQELVEQWTAAHQIAPTPAREERKGLILRETYVDAAGATRVESVLIDGLGHAFPIDGGGGASCGQPGAFVVDAGLCAVAAIAEFWGLADKP